MFFDEETKVTNDYTYDFTGARKAFDEMYNKGYNPTSIFQESASYNQIEYMARRTEFGGYLQPDAFDEIMRYQYTWAEENERAIKMQQEEAKREQEMREYEKQLEEDRLEAERVEEELRLLDEEMREFEEEMRMLEKERKDEQYAKNILSYYNIKWEDCNNTMREFFIAVYSNEKTYNKDLIYMMKRMFNLSDKEALSSVNPLELYEKTRFLYSANGGYITQSYNDMLSIIDEADKYSYLALNPLSDESEITRSSRVGKIKLGNAYLACDTFSKYPIRFENEEEKFLESMQAGGHDKAIARLIPYKAVLSSYGAIKKMNPIFLAIASMVITFILTYEAIGNFSYIASILSFALSFLFNLIKNPCTLERPIYESNISKTQVYYRPYAAYAMMSIKGTRPYIGKALDKNIRGIRDSLNKTVNLLNEKEAKVLSMESEYEKEITAFNKASNRKSLVNSIAVTLIVSIVSFVISVIL